MKARKLGIIAALGGSTAALAMLTGLAGARADDLQINQQLLDTRVDQLAQGQNPGAKNQFSTDANTPGVAGAATISFNHKFILDPRCRAGALDGNPAHEDMLEACGLFKPDFLLNAILNANGKLAGVVAGHYDQAHRAGCETVNEIHQVPFERPYDVVIASAGGFPFDIDLRQAHKGMENAARALRAGGTLLYFAECREGAGIGALSEWVERFSSSGEMALALQSHFVVGGHKAYWIVRLGERMRVLLVSELPETLVRNCRLFAVSDPATALRNALKEAGPKARVAYMPDASLTFPSSSMEARVTTAAA